MWIQFSPLVLHGTQCVEITGLDDGAGGKTQDLHCSEKCNQTLLGRWYGLHQRSAEDAEHVWDNQRDALPTPILFGRFRPKHLFL